MIYRSILFFLSMLASFGNACCADDLSGFDAPGLGVEVISIVEAEDKFKEEKIELPTKNGLILLHVEPNGPAANAKLQRMDIVTNVNKKAVKSTDEFKDVVSSLTIGKEVEVTGYRALLAQGKLRWKKGSVKVSPCSMRDVVINALRVKTDEIRGTSSFTHSDSTEFVNSQSELYAYIVKSASGVHVLRLHIQYVAKDWLFIKRFNIKADEQVFTLTAEGIRDVERDNGSSKVWEWHDRPVGEAEKKMLVAICQAKKVLLRCEGNQYQSDRRLSDPEIHRIRTVLNAYRIMAGN